MINFFEQNKNTILTIFKIVSKILNIIINIVLCITFVITLMLFFTSLLMTKFYDTIEPITDDEIVLNSSSPDGRYGVIAINEKYQELLAPSIAETYHNKPDVLLNVFWTDFTEKETIKYCDIPFNDFSKEYELSLIWGDESCQLFIDDEEHHRGYEIPYQPYAEIEDLQVTYNGEIQDFEYEVFKNYYDVFYPEDLE